ncbi:MAG: NAD(P)/FAD-dependent oxidoreductase [Thermoplasmatota archaeon]
MDVVIVGAGPAGLITGLQLLERGESPVICEKQPGIVTTVCAEACDSNSLKQLPFDSTPYIAHEVEGAYAVFPGDSHFEIPKPGVVLDRQRWLQGLATAFEQRGGVLRTGTTVTSTTDSGVMLQDGEHLQADIVVGADGPYSRLRKQMEIPQELICGVQYRVACDTSDMDHLRFYFDKRFSEHYGWLFPRGEVVNVGLSGKCRQLDRLLAHLGFDAAAVTEKMAGAIPVGGVPKRLVDGNRVLIGDAASMTNPLSGGGLTPIAHASALLARYIDDLKRYEQAVHAHPMADKSIVRAKNVLLRLSVEDLRKMGDLVDGKTMYELGHRDRIAALRYPLLAPSFKAMAKGVALSLEWGW